MGKAVNFLRPKSEKIVTESQQKLQNSHSLLAVWIEAYYKSIIFIFSVKNEQYSFSN